MYPNKDDLFGQLRLLKQQLDDTLTTPPEDFKRFVDTDVGPTGRYDFMIGDFAIINWKIRSIPHPDLIEA